MVSSEVTQILNQISDGNEEAINQLVPMVYQQMRNIAAGAMRSKPVEDFDPTELVHEAYLRLIGNENLAWKNRAHFFGACAIVIRRVLVDRVRAQHALKRGDQLNRVDLTTQHLANSSDRVDLIALDDALKELEAMAPRQSKLVELRFFGGLTEDESAEVLQVSRRTVSNDWAVAKAWLKAKLI